MKSDLSKVKVGDKIWTIQEGWTNVETRTEYFEYPISTKKGYTYALDGKSHRDDIHPSAFLECQFKEEPIEKDTLVYFRNNENECWKIGYYSHFRDGIHWCYVGSKKSTETKRVEDWNIVTTENPLSC